MDRRDAKNLVLRNQEVDLAYLTDGQSNPGQAFKRVTLDLSVAQSEFSPLRVSTKFKSMFVETATDLNTLVYLKPLGNDSSQDAMKIRQNSSWSSDYIISSGYLYWDAQPGKTMDILFFIDSKFESGSQISISAGGVSINSGSSFTTKAVILPIRVTQPVRTLILTANPLRKKATIKFEPFAGTPLGFICPTNTGGTANSYLMVPNVAFEWTNTAELWGFCNDLVNAINVSVIEEF